MSLLKKWGPLVLLLFIAGGAFYALLSDYNCMPIIELQKMHLLMTRKH